MESEQTWSTGHFSSVWSWHFNCVHHCPQGVQVDSACAITEVYQTLGLGDIDFFVYHNILGGYHNIPDILVEFKLLEIKVTLKLD